MLTVDNRCIDQPVNVGRQDMEVGPVVEIDIDLGQVMGGRREAADRLPKRGGLSARRIKVVEQDVVQLVRGGEPRAARQVGRQRRR